MEETEKDDIINDYNDMYENYLDYGMTEEEVEEKLGRPRDIIGSLTEGYGRAKEAPNNRSKIIAIMPFISVITFFLIGSLLDGWHYAWIVFLSIPMSAIILEMGHKKDKHITTALSPFIAVITFFVLGFGFGLWHPGWAIFLLIPVTAIFNSRKSMKFFEFLTAISPFVAVIIFVTLGLERDLWHPGWVIFFIIPALGLLNEKDITRMIISEVLLLGGVAFYLYLGYEFGLWGYGALVFVPFVGYQVMIGNISIVSDEVPLGYKVVVLSTIAIYFIVSYVTGLWFITWLIFFAIPVYAITRETRGSERMIALTPFIAVTLFMLIGFFLNGWMYAWIAFLIIPMTAILKSK
jgi:MFS family permease